MKYWSVCQVWTIDFCEMDDSVMFARNPDLNEFRSHGMLIEILFSELIFSFLSRTYKRFGLLKVETLLVRIALPAAEDIDVSKH